MREEVRGSPSRRRLRHLAFYVFVFIVVLFLAFRGVACSSLHQEDKDTEKGRTTNSSLLQKIRGGGNFDEKKKYIVTLKSRYESFKLCKERKEFNCKKAFRSGFTVFATEQELERMKLDLDASRIEDIEEDAIVSKMSPPWHLDRIDQNYLPLDNRLSFSDLDGTQRGEGVYVYVLDTGVQSKHAELRGKIDSHVTALDPDEDDLLDLDPDGHGTFCASLIAGRTTGVAPGAKIVSVRVLNSDGAGSVSDVVAGLEWTSDQILSKQAENSNMFKGAVVLLALGAPIGVRSRALENAVDRFARETNSLLVTASGNQNADACASVPARSSRCMTVAATDSRDMNYAWNNLGRCVDVFAPGVRLVGACAGQNRCTKKNEVDAITAKSSHNDDDDDIESLYGHQSGTSMAAAVAAGAAARILSENPNFGAEEVKGIIIRNATRGIVVLGSSSVLYTMTYNRLLRLH
jgi:subtilisin family serine protease